MAAFVIGRLVTVRVIKPVDRKHVGAPYLRPIPQNNLGAVVGKKGVLGDRYLLRETIPKLFVVKRNVIVGLVCVDLGHRNSASKHP